jgi:hypothetical protein
VVSPRPDGRTEQAFHARLSLIQDFEPWVYDKNVAFETALVSDRVGLARMLFEGTPVPCTRSARPRETAVVSLVAHFVPGRRSSPA